MKYIISGYSIVNGNVHVSYFDNFTSRWSVNYKHTSTPILFDTLSKVRPIYQFITDNCPLIYAHRDYKIEIIEL